MVKEEEEEELMDEVPIDMRIFANQLANINAQLGDVELQKPDDAMGAI
jgi:hypothetical protein